MGEPGTPRRGETLSARHPRGGPEEGERFVDPYRVFVGRERELESLVRVLQEAQAGRGRLLLLAGEPGIGKTRLADEVAAQAGRAGAAVLWGRCWEAGGAPAFWPWVQALRDFVRTLEDQVLRQMLGAGASEIAPLLPELKDRLPDLPDPPPASPDGARFRLFDAISEFLRRASAHRAIAVILEDLHAADAPSVLLLRFVAEALARSHVLLVGTYRDTDLRPGEALASTLPELLRARGALRLTVSGLSSEDVASLIRAVSGKNPSEQLVRAIHDETEGNPLFVREIVQLLSSEGRLSEHMDPRRWGVPEGVREVIGRRLERLSKEGHEMLAVASVLGRDFTVEALQGVSQRSAQEILGSLRDALTARVIVEVPGMPGRFRFAHSLIRDTLYEDLGPARRISLHRAVAEVLERLYAPDPHPHLAELAHHFFEAAPGGDPEKAAEYARGAGEQAVSQLAYEEAVRLFRMALEALERSPDEESRCRLLLVLGDAQTRAGDGEAARETFLDAASIATRLDMPDLLARSALGYGGRFIWLRAGTDRQVIPLLEQALAALSTEDSRLRALLLARLAGALRDQPSVERRASLSAEALEMARRIGDPSTLMQTIVGRWAAVALGADGLDEQLRLAGELDRLAQEVGDPERAMDPYWFRFINFMTRGLVREARREHEGFTRAARALRQPSQQWYAGVIATILALQDGRFREAEDLIERAHELGRRAQHWDAGASELLALFVLRREQGRLAELEQDRRRALDEYPGYRGFRCMVIVSLCELGELDDARRMFDRLAQEDFAALPKDNEWLSNLTLLAEAADAFGDRDRAATLYRLLSPYAGLVALAASEVSMGPVDRALGVLASLMGRHEDASRHFEDSLEMCERMGARPWGVHTRHDYARMLLRRGEAADRERAVSLLTEALATARELGMVALEGKVTGLLAELGIQAARGEGETRPEVVAAQSASVFRLEGEYFSIVYEGQSFRLRDTKGLRYVAHLLTNPGREVHVLDLVAAADGGRSTGGTPAESELEARPEAAVEILDPRARAAYKQRIVELEQDMEEAEGFGDAERAARAREEMEFILAELAAATGLGGRDRGAASAPERARQAVTKAIRAAVARIEEASPAFGKHLRATLRTGMFCSYTPDPRAPTEWNG